MVFTASKVLATGMLLLSLVINLSFIYGMVTRPVISYHLSTPLDYNETIDTATEILPVEFKIRNEGLSPTRVQLVIRLYNMSPPRTEAFSVKEVDGAFILRAPLDLPPHQLEHETLEAKFESAANATHIVLIFSVEGDWKAELATRFHTSFAIYKPERPTALLLKHTGDMTFKRVRRR